MFGPVNFLLRWLFTMLLVFSTYNPSGRSFYHWAIGGDAPGALAASLGIAMLAGYIFLIRSMLRSMKSGGVALVAVFLLLFNIMLVDLGLVTVSGGWVVTVMTQVSVATLLTIGLSFSAIRARLAGQIDSDDVGR